MYVFCTGDASLPLIFNLHCSVGRGGQNAQLDDIMLVQYLMRKVVEKMPGSTPEARAADEAIRKVPVSGVCDQATIAGIEAFQKSLKAKNPQVIVDGRMSPAKAVSYGGAVWSIVQLNNFIRVSQKEYWPRLQDLADCPSLLQGRFNEVM